ncbi:MAG: 50S ribosomal protein L10 [Bacteroidales bacterium]|nr:50S ribosomal protein L10 [Candidatus Cryptobacteroides caccocaballi]
MRKEVKVQILDSISAQLQEYPNFYITDISGLDAEQTSKLRRECFERGILLSVVKNTLFSKGIDAMGKEDAAAVKAALEGPTAIMYTKVANAPAKLIKKMQDDGMEKPVLKAAYLVESGAYVGPEHLNTLVNIKSREEMIADIVLMLQQAAGQKIAGILKTMEEKKSEE